MAELGLRISFASSEKPCSGEQQTNYLARTILSVDLCDTLGAYTSSQHYVCLLASGRNMDDVLPPFGHLGSGLEQRGLNTQRSRLESCKGWCRIPDYVTHQHFGSGFFQLLDFSLQPISKENSSKTNRVPC